MVLHLRAWYWEAKCFNGWLNREKVHPGVMRLLVAHKNAADRSAERGYWCPMRSGEKL